MTTKGMLPWPEPIKREGPYKVYKGHEYTVYDDGNSAETPYQTDLAEAALSRLRIAVEALKDMRSDIAYDSDCVSVLEDKINETLAEIGEIPQS